MRRNEVLEVPVPESWRVRPVVLGAREPVKVRVPAETRIFVSPPPPVIVMSPLTVLLPASLIRAPVLLLVA